MKDLTVSLVRVSRGESFPIPMVICEQCSIDKVHEVLNVSKIRFDIENNSGDTFAIILGPQLSFYQTKRKAIIIRPQAYTVVPISFKRRDRQLTFTVQRLGTGEVAYYWRFRVRLVKSLEESERLFEFEPENAYERGYCPGPH